MRLAQELRRGDITQAEFDVEFPELDAEVKRLRAIYEETSDGLSSQQRRWMPADRLASHYAYSGN